PLLLAAHIEQCSSPLDSVATVAPEGYLRESTPCSPHPGNTNRRRPRSPPIGERGDSGQSTWALRPASPLTVAALLLEAVRAVDRLIAARLERHLGLLATLRAGRGEHLAAWPIAAVAAFGAPTALVRRSTGGATGGFVGEALLCEELLLPFREGERGTAVAASQRLVGIARVTHEDPLRARVGLGRSS